MSLDAGTLPPLNYFLGVRLKRRCRDTADIWQSFLLIAQLCTIHTSMLVTSWR